MDYSQKLTFIVPSTESGKIFALAPHDSFARASPSKGVSEIITRYYIECLPSGNLKMLLSAYQLVWYPTLIMFTLQDTGSFPLDAVISTS